MIPASMETQGREEEEEGEEADIFTVTPSRGFLPCRDPLPRLPVGPVSPYYEAWEGLGDDLPKLLIGGGDLMRSRIRARLPPIQGTLRPIRELLAGRPSDELERVLLLLSFIAHAYVWGRPGDHPSEALPEALATPWVAASALRGGRPPILTYASFNLYNWRRLDPSSQVALGDLACLNNFLSGLDEEWFRHVHIEIEARAAKAVAAIMAYQQARTREALLRALASMETTLGEIKSVLSRMGEGCDPHMYHHRVRTWMSGWRNNPRLPQGLLYEGGHGRLHYYGETGAQSAIIPCFDAFLTISHEHDSMREYLLDMRGYMPAPHQAFLHSLEAMSPPVREVVEKAEEEATAAADRVTSTSGSELRQAYDRTVKALATFRNLHLRYADRYIRQPAREEQKQEEEVGTGGTDFMVYLAKHCRETQAHLLGERDEGR